MNGCYELNIYTLITCDVCLHLNICIHTIVSDSVLCAVDYKWRATAEGDTVVMLLETAKYLVKKAQEVQSHPPNISLPQSNQLPPLAAAILRL